MRINNSVKDLVGKTPLLRLNNIEKMFNTNSKIIAKLECFNPAGSAKDRAALSMIEQAELKGVLKKGATIVEPTSGNTGIALASIGISRGYKVILTMPETMSVERQMLLKAYGAEIILTPGNKGMAGAVEESERICKETENAVILGQFDNSDNPLAHYKTTGPEIFEDMDGKIDIFIAGIGTGGTISGVGKYLKEKNEKIKIIGIEPESSPVITKGISASHKIQGIGANFIPKNLDLSVCDEIVTVSNENALSMGNAVAKNEGLLIGISSGAAVSAAVEIAKKEKNKNIVVLLPDGGEKYLSTEMYK